ncbi:MAG: pseudouridine synthase [Legionellaceae bacterium]|nr:pseudouridine synthase [Legionellaceae bacterium]
MSGERLQKVLSQAGLGSRREMEVWIKDGKVQLNGRIATLGDVVVPTDKIKVRGKVVRNPLRTPSRTRVLIYHKPVGEIASRSDPNHSKTVFDNLPILKRGRWIQVGRLDINTTGHFIFNNDGTFANKMFHPKYQIEREYAVRVHGRVKPEMIQVLQKGVQLEDGLAAFKAITFQGGGEAANAWYHVVLTEGRNREVRRLWASQGIEVSRLIRIRYGSLSMPRFLGRGQHMELSADDVAAFMKTVLEEPSV